MFSFTNLKFLDDWDVKLEGNITINNISANNSKKIKMDIKASDLRLISCIQECHNINTLFYLYMNSSDFLVDT